MSVPSYLLLLILLIARVACGYTVILNSGKQIQGTLVSDESLTIRIKDSKGVLISFNKSRLDLIAMSAANRPPDSPVIDRPAEIRPPDIVEIARQNKRSRTGKVRAFTQSDLDHIPEISIFGSEYSDRLPKGDSSRSNYPDKEWQSRVWSYKKDVNRIREKRISLEESCDRSKERQRAQRTIPSRKPVDVPATYQESPECRRLSEIDRQLTEAELRLENLREEARRAGVPWQVTE